MQEINLDWILTKVKNLMRFLPDDGSVGQILRRTAHGAEWSNEQGGGAVSSVNGQTGAVVLTASDVGALPDTYAAPVDSVNGQTGTVVLSIPSDTADLTNTAGFVNAAGAAAAAPVQSVNSQTGAVVLSIPSDTADLTNTAGFVNAAGAAAAAPVQSVNGQTGAVSIATGIQADLLWTNPNPSISFSGQTLPLSLNAYKLIMIVFNATAMDTAKITQVFAYADGVSTLMFCLYNPPNTIGAALIRSFTIASTGLTFNNATKKDFNSTSRSEDNSRVVPVYIYGIK